MQEIDGDPDAEGDQRADGTSDEVWMRWYDRGNLVYENHDEDADGLVERWERWTYDEHGRLLRHGRGHHGVEGDFEEQEEWAYDERGNMVRHDVFSQRERWTYDARDNVLSYQVDHDSDGDPEVCNVWTYDGRDNVLTEDEDGMFPGSGPCDGVVDRRKTWTYDERDNRLTEDLDGPVYLGDEYPCDGVSDLRTAWTYDLDDNVLSEERDRHADARPERLDTWTYDPSGRLRSHEVGLDEGPDGSIVPVWRETVTYGEDGRKSSRERTDLRTGDREWRTTWTWDELGNKLTEVRDRNGDGTPDSRTEWAYDEHGNVVLERHGADGDGADDSTTAWTFNAWCAPTSLEVWDHRETGDTLREVTRWVYDDEGRLTAMEHDGGFDKMGMPSFPADGHVDWRMSWTGDCPP